MWISVDRIEKDRVILIDDAEKIYSLTVSDYQALVGRPPEEAHMLLCDTQDGVILAARFDPEETERRVQATRDKLARLANQSKRKG